LGRTQIGDSVPESQLRVIFAFVTHIYQNIRAKKLRFQNQMNLAVKSKYPSVAVQVLLSEG
jgi:hypothetical protein